MIQVDAALASMSFRQFHAWYLHYLDEPFGWEMEQYRHSELCALVGNAPHWYPKTCYKPTDFHFKNQDPKPDRPMTPDEVKSKL